LACYLLLSVNSNVRASSVVRSVGCLGSFVWSTPAVAIEQDPELAGRRQQMAQSLAACRSHLPPAPRCQLEPDITNCYDFLKVETKDSGHTLRFDVLQFILSLERLYNC
jgi:hypothetical protein